MLAEQMVLNFNRLKKIQNTASLRIFNVYGDGNYSQSDVISKFAQRLSNGLGPVIYGNGDYTRDFISVDDVTDSMLLSVKTMENEDNDIQSSTPVFNIGSGKGTSVNDIAKKMIALSGLEIEPSYEKGNQESGVILHSYADIKKAKKVLQFTAKKNLDQGLTELIEGIRITRTSAK
jgi:UDP-glucose 4-epimerase